MKAIQKYFNDMKLRSKLVFSFMIAVIIPLLIVGFLLTQELRTNALKDAKSQLSSDLERVKLRTAETLETAIYVSNNLTLDSELKEIVNKNYKSTIEVVSAYNQYNKIEEYLQNYSEISNIRIYTRNKTMLNNWHFIPISNKEKNDFWYRAAEKANGLIGWYYIADETKNNEKFLSLVRNINFFDYKSHAILVINVNTSRLYEMLNQEQTPIMILDDNNNVVVSNRNGFIGKRINEIVNADKPIEEWTGTFTGEVDGEKAEVVVDILLPETSINKLKFVSVVPKHVIMEDANRFVLLGTLVIIISMIVALVLIYIFSHLLSNRILGLGQQIDQVSEGDLSTIIHVEGEDEIGHLSNQLNQMVNNIKDLIDEVERVHIENNILEKRQQEIKLKMMASQINPHFLFNALESIRMKAHIKGEKEIAGVVKLLGKLMRKSISVTGEMVTLKSEMEIVQCYLDIQKFRYDNRLAYSLQIDPKAEDVLVHPLIIQPLVENAVLHGLEDNAAGGMVEVKAYVEDNHLHVQVADNGVGISTEKLNLIDQALNHIEDTRENRIGLMNVHQRLILTFGKQSGLVINSQPNEGTTISFTIPIRGNKIV